MATGGMGGTLGPFPCVSANDCDGATQFCETVHSGAGSGGGSACLGLPGDCNGIPACDCLLAATSCDKCTFQGGGFYVDCNSNAGAGGGG